MFIIFQHKLRTHYVLISFPIFFWNLSTSVRISTPWITSSNSLSPLKFTWSIQMHFIKYIFVRTALLDNFFPFLLKIHYDMHFETFKSLHKVWNKSLICCIINYYLNTVTQRLCKRKRKLFIWLRTITSSCNFNQMSARSTNCGCNNDKNNENLIVCTLNKLLKQALIFALILVTAN